MRKVSVQDDDIVITLTPNQTKQLRIWLESQEEIKGLPDPIIAKFCVASNAYFGVKP